MVAADFERIHRSNLVGMGRRSIVGQEWGKLMSLELDRRGNLLRVGPLQ